MAKQFLDLVKICEAITKYSVFALVILMPVIFFSWTVDALNFNKQALLILLAFVAFFAWMAKSLIHGKLTLRPSKIHFAFLGMLLVFILATVFSIDKRGSFWGWPSITSEALLTILGFGIVYFLVSNTFSRSNIINLIIAAGLSGALAVLAGTFQLLGIFLPFSFTKTASFNSIGMVGELGLFAVILLPLSIVLAMQSKKWLRIIFCIAIAVIALCLVLINYSLVWWLVLAVSTLLILIGIIEKELFDLRWLGLPMFFLALSLFFIVLQFQLPSVQRPVEVFLKQSAGFEVTKQIIKESPFFGSGPGTFSYDFSKHRSADLNQGILWNIRFNGAGSRALTVLATTGILGFLGFLSFLGFLVFYGVKFLLQKFTQNNQKDYLVFGGAVLAALLLLVIAYFIYESSMVLDFMFFFLAACFVALFWKEKKEVSLNPSSFLTLGITFLAICVFIFGLGLLVLSGQRYAAEVNYASGLRALAAGDVDRGIEKLEKAVGLNPKTDIYLTQLSQTYLLKLNQIIGSKEISDQEKSQISQLLLNNLINSAKLATDVNPQNPSNWITRGLVYQNLIGTINDSENWALNSYEQGFQLEPSSPYYPNQKGIVYMIKANILDKDDAKKRNEDLDSAKKEFDKALELKSDYAPAHFQTAIYYQTKGQSVEQIKALEETKRYSPNDVGLLFQLGLIYYQKKDFNNAKSNLEAATSMSPDYANALYFLGLTYFELGRNSEAINQFKKVSDLNPDNEQIKTILINLNSGKDPLAGISQENPQQAPVEETPVEKP